MFLQFITINKMITNYSGYIYVDEDLRLLYLTFILLKSKWANRDDSWFPFINTNGMKDFPL